MEELRSSRTGRYGFLLLALVAVVLGAPPLLETGASLLATEGLFLLMMLACAVALGDVPALRWAVLALAAAAIAGDILLRFHFTPGLWLGARGLGAGLLALVAGGVLHQLLREERVSVDTILGGICVYLLLGLVFYSLFGILEFLHPGSFAVDGVPLHEPGTSPETSDRRPALLYFSFVTLSTVGYGDMVPTWALPRMLATAEAVLGQLYLAILVASLVGMHLAARQAKT